MRTGLESRMSATCLTKLLPSGAPGASSVHGRAQHALGAVLLAALALAPAQAGPTYALSSARAVVTHDAAPLGNVKHGNLPNPGDELGWTLDAIEPGAYRVELDVRTGSRGEGTDYVAAYSMIAPSRCLASGRGEEIGFSLSPNCRPRVTLRGKNWAVYRGLIVAKDKLVLHRGDQLRVRCSGHYACVYRLVLSRLSGHDLLGLALSVDQYVSLFVAGEPVSVSATVANVGAAMFSGVVAFHATDEKGANIDKGRLPVTVQPRSQQVVHWRPRIKRLGPFFVKAALLQAQEEVCSDEVNLAVIPRADLGAAPDSSPFGIHKGDLTDWPPIGAKWNRLWDTSDTWNRMQPHEGAIHFSKQDEKVRQARRHGVNLLFVFAYTPTWASAHPEWPHYTGGGATSAPKDVNTWRHYVFEVVSRYRSHIEHFEVWNEPNAGFFKGTVEEYAQLLSAAYRSAKRANPDCRVLGISGTGGYLPWMEEVLKLDGLRHMDVVSVHTYTTPSSPEEANLIGRLAATRKLIHRYGGRQTIWNTEIGCWVPERRGCRPLTPDEIAAKAPKDIAPNWQPNWPYRPIDEYSAAAHLARHYVLNLAGGVEHVFWYAWYTQIHPMYTVRQAPRMHTVAYAGAAARLSDARYAERVDLGASDLHIHLFHKPSGPIAVAWRSTSAPRSVAVPTSTVSRLWDMWGNCTTRPATGRVELNLTPRPLYLMGPSLAEMRRSHLAGERFVFEAVDAAASRDVGNGKVREMTSAPHHGARRVVGLPDPGDEIEWTLRGIDRAMYELRFDLRTGSRAPGTDLVKTYRVCAAGANSEALALHVAPDARVEETRRNPKYSMFYGEVVAARHVELGVGDKVALSCLQAWAYVGKLILLKVAELPDTETIPCRPLSGVPSLDTARWPAAPDIALRDRRQVVIGVADRFASTSERDGWRGPADVSATARIAWTSHALHVLVHVVDDALMPAAAGQGLWNGDCVELFLDLRGQADVGSPALTAGVFQICCAAPRSQSLAPTPLRGRCPDGVTAQGIRSKRGYSILVAVPWQRGALGLPEPGRLVGLDIAVDDADNAGDARAKRKAQVVWRGTANNFQDPSAYARIVLRR